MFRKPRENSNGDSGKGGFAKPSTGRPPTPPDLRAVDNGGSTRSEMTSSKGPSRTSTAGKPLAGSPAKGNKPMPKARPKANGNILSFFKKVDPSIREEPGLFIGNGHQDDEPIGQVSDKAEQVALTAVEKEEDEEEESRYNESNASVKRRRLSFESGCMDIQQSADATQQKHQRSIVEPSHTETVSQTPEARSKGPFVDSDSEDEVADAVSATTDRQPSSENTTPPEIVAPEERKNSAEFKVPFASGPSLLRTSTSFPPDEDYGAPEEFGEEFFERQWMEEQEQMEREFEDDDTLVEGATNTAKGDIGATSGASEHEAMPPCPICGTSMHGYSAEQASVHVNRCLDGGPPEQPAAPAVKAEPDAMASPGPSAPATKAEPEQTLESSGPSHKRFQRSAIARPAQANPFTLDPVAKGGASAFTKLMSSHAEDEAWATAAANEVEARGKPAFKRTCPFYKILPGFFVCVDAFRYGAVEGCSAYFLSHFHSDHFIGLTSSWCHGPIYCSRVTGNLVRQQLRVDPRWVVDLEFEKDTEVPGTDGVSVTMLPANHCPGSSLFLFEKEIVAASHGHSSSGDSNKKRGGGSARRMQRVLHCGDFRACPAHVRHPLLRPDVLDPLTGKHREQKIDVCYLDTTYLNPRYAFPTQDSVIRACAELCVSLNRERPDEMEDANLKGRDSALMTKFMRKGSTEAAAVAAAEQGNATGATTASETTTTAATPTASLPMQITTPGRGRLLVVVGTYSIGKERICLGIARALKSKIYATANKQRVCRALEDAELSSLLTSNPLEAQVHMQMLMEIRAETLAEYLRDYRPHFSRVVGFRPSGWNYRPPSGRFLESPAVQTVLHSDSWRPTYSAAELSPQRGSTREAACYGVPYSEHSSFRELTMFCCALRIGRIIPTVNVGSAKSREKMKAWIDRWAVERKKNGLYALEGDAGSW